MKPEDIREIAARDWEQYFRKANVLVQELDENKSKHSKAIKMGKFLGPNVNREVSVDANGRTGKAVLRVTEGRAKQKLYFFEITWDDNAVAEASPATVPARPTSEARVDKTNVPVPDVLAERTTNFTGETVNGQRGAAGDGVETATVNPDMIQGAGNNLDW